MNYPDQKHEVNVVFSHNLRKKINQLDIAKNFDDYSNDEQIYQTNVKVVKTIQAAHVNVITWRLHWNDVEILNYADFLTAAIKTEYKLNRIEKIRLCVETNYHAEFFKE